MFEGDCRIKDFPAIQPVQGNFRRKKEKQERQTEPETKPSRPAPPVKQSPANFVKEKKELEELEEMIGKLENEKSALLNALNSGMLSPDELLAKSRLFSELTSQLEEKELRWLELSEKM